MPNIRRPIRTLALLILLLVGGLNTAHAHGYIVRSIPENRAVLERPPTRLQYWFSEALEPDFSTMRLRDQGGEVIAEGGVSENDDALMTLRVPGDLPDGAYIVELRPAFASDGHVVAESRVFFVGEEIGGVAGAGAEDQAVPLEVVWRAITLSASVLLFGTLTLYAMVLVPAWGSTDHTAGLLPPRVMRRLNVIAGYALAAAFLGNGLALIQQTMTFFNIGFWDALNPDFWSLVRIGSRFGDIWNWRIAFLGAVGTMYLLSINLAKNQPETVRAFWVANGWMAALVLGSYSVLSHAAGSLLWPWVGITVDWLHLIAVGLWAGGVAALTLVLPAALRPYEGEARRLALLAVLRRFSRLAVAAVALVVTTGIYSASNWIYGPEEAATPFGGALALKIALILALLAFGGLHHIALRPERYARFDALIRQASGFLPTLRLESVFAAAVLVAAGLLSATPVPVPAFAENEVEAPTQAFETGDWTVVMSILPGGPGVNTFDTVITQDGERVPGLDVQLIKAHPASDYRGDQQVLEPVEDGLYVTATDDIDEAGRWWSLLDITSGDGEVRRIALDWDISAEASVIESLDPTLANIAALTAVVLAVLWVSGPTLRRLFQALNLDTFSVSVGVAATALTVVALVGGYIIVQQTRQDYEETLNPPPQIINEVLPSQASLDRGERFYNDHCIVWQTQARDFNALREALPTLRDEALHAAITEGWRDLPPCDGDLNRYQVWDVVNFVRTLARDPA